MSNTKTNIFVVNAGSSSLKYKIFSMPGEKLLHAGLVERIDGNHAAQLKAVSAKLKSKYKIDAIAHRVVHGGTYFTWVTRINNIVKDKINELSVLAPLHNSINLECINTTEKIFEHLPQFAAFDTTFHHRIPPEASRYAISESISSALSIRAFGFHGISHQYVCSAAQGLVKKDTLIISLHLGNGCSIAAIKNGICIDTSMGFSPTSGLVMATRSGDIDPFVPLYLTRELGWTTEDVEHLLNKEAGLKGLCGKDDMREVKEAIKNNDTAATLARKLYVYRVRKYIGAYAAALGGLDILIFTGGVGENDADLRQEICNGMEWLQLKLDQKINLSAPADKISEINMKSSKCKILVIPTNEELEIARETWESGELG